MSWLAWLINSTSYSIPLPSYSLFPAKLLKRLANPSSLLPGDLCLM